jgi:hypothetical protein
MTKLTNSALDRGGHSYESPALEIINIIAEGVLCGSTGDGTFSLPAWEYDNSDDGLNF